jgi:hypothetical protein
LTITRAEESRVTIAFAWQEQSTDARRDSRIHPKKQPERALDARAEIVENKHNQTRAGD